MGSRPRHAPVGLTSQPARPASVAGAADAAPVMELLGMLDHPADGTMVPRSVFSSWGWVLDPMGPVAAVLVLVDGRVVAVLDADQPRPDVASVHAGIAGDGDCGWATRIDLRKHQGDAAELGVVVVRADGSSELRHRARVQVVHPSLVAGGQDELTAARFDHPVPGQVVPRRALAVWGWALFDSGPAGAVRLSLDGVAIEPARVGLPRPDIEDIPIAGAEIAGFETVIDLSVIPAHVTEVTIGGTALGLAGEVVELEPIGIRLEPAPRAFSDDGEAERLRARTPTAAPRRDPDGRHHLLVITHHLGFGGGQLYLQELLRLLCGEEGVTAEVVAPTDGPLRRELERMGIPVHICGPYPIDGVAEYEGCIHALAAWAQPRGFTAALVNTMLAFHGADLADRLGLPCLWAIHESMTVPMYWAVAYPPELLHAYVRTRGEKALGTAQAVIFEADATRRDYQPHGDPQRYVVIPYGIDLAAIDRYRATADRASIRRRLGIAADATVILCVGTFERRKAQTALLRAFAALGDQARNAHLVLVGDTGGEYSRAAHRYIREADLESRVTVAPVVKDIYPWYAVADLLVCASDVESLPRSVLEVMAFETPVLATAVYGLPELIEHGRTGWLCAPRDVAALRDGLAAALAAGPDGRRAIGVAGSTMVRARYDSRGYARDYLRLLNALASDPDALPRNVLG